MDESEDNMSSEDLKSPNSSTNVKSKPKKRSLIERELETSLTSRITSPVTVGDGTSTSRYGRARRLKTEMELSDTKKVPSEMKSPISEKSPVKTQSPVYKMHASNSPMRTESPKKIGVETFLENQIESIYQENISLSRFGTEEVKTTSPSPAKKFPKVYIRKDLIQKRESDESAMFIKNMFSPVKSTRKSSNTHLNNILERSSEKFSSSSTKQNGFLDNSSVVKTLDFDSKKKKKESKDSLKVLSKSDLFELEAKCPYQVGDLAWARMGTYPFWPSIVTRDPSNGVFVKKKLFGRIERDVIHVTFFGDNGRRGWIVDTMLRRYLGQLEFESTRENFTPEDKKKDPRLYAAFFVSEKKQALWNTSVEEAEMLLREPKRLRIDIFNDMLEKSRLRAKQQKSGKISRTDSDVSLSESLYDSLFSEDDGKTDNTERSRNRTRNKSLDVFEVVTACLDNMAAKTGITKIQRQSHMDRWLQKAKSKTPEKAQARPLVPQGKSEEKKESKANSKKKKSMPTVPINKPYSLRKSMTESQNLLPFQNEHDYSKSIHEITDSDQNSTDTDSCKNSVSQDPCGLGIIAKVESIAEKLEDSNEKDKEETKCPDAENAEEPAVNVNGTSKENSASMNESRQISCIAKFSDNDKVTEEDNNEESPEKELVDDNQEPDRLDTFRNSFQDVANNTSQDNNVIRDMITSPIYEDSYSEDTQQSQSSVNDDSATENVGTDPENIMSKLQEYANDTSTVASTDLTEVSDLSADDIDDSDYRPEYSTESDVTGDNLSLLAASFTNNSAEEFVQDDILSKNNKELGTISVKENGICDDVKNNCIDYAYQVSNKKKVKKDKSRKKKGSNELMDVDTSASDILETSQDSVISTRSKTRRKLRSKQDKKLDYSIESAEFINYLEMRQDALLDENPDLTEEEIKAYLYKAWLYEVKRDVNEDDSSKNSESDLMNDKKYTSHENTDFGNELMDVDTSATESMENGFINENHEIKNNTIDIADRISTNLQGEIEICKEPADSVTNKTTNREIPESVTSHECINGIAAVKDTGKVPVNRGIEEIPNHKLLESVTNNESINSHINIKDYIDTNKVTADCEMKEIPNNDIENSIMNNKSKNGNLHVKDSIDKDKITVDSVIEEIQNNVPIESVMSNETVNGHVNVKEVDVNAAKEIHLPVSSKTIIENGFHDGEHESNSGIDLDAVSVHSEDSVSSTKSENRRKLRSKQDKKQDNPLENAEFVKYLEMRQDDIMDENPDLTQEEIVAYLYKTWLYEESVKSDDKKNDDLREFNLVKGLNTEPGQKRIHKEVDQSKSKAQNKKSLSLNKNSMEKFLHKKRIEESNKMVMALDKISNNSEISNNVMNVKNIDNKTTNGRDMHDKLTDNEGSGNPCNEKNTPQSSETEISLGTTPIEETKETCVNSSNQNENGTEPTITDGIRSETNAEPLPIDPSNATKVDFPQEPQKPRINEDFDGDSIDSEDSEIPLIRLRSKARRENGVKEDSVSKKLKEDEIDSISINSEDSEVSVTRRRKKIAPKNIENALEDPDFVKYLELRQDALIDENPQLSQDEIVAYLYQTWLYEEDNKSEIKKTDEIEQSTLVKGLHDGVQQPKKIKRKNKTEKEINDDVVVPKEKPRRKAIKPYYNEEYSDIEEELEVFEIFKSKNKQASKETTGETCQESEQIEEINDVDEVELYFEELTKPKPNIFKGLTREKVCEICEKTGHLVKCKGCHGMFHVDCVAKEIVKVEAPTPTRGRKKKKKVGRRPKNPEDPENQDDKSQDVSEENNVSIEEIIESESHTVDADTLESQLEAKMKEILEKTENIDDYSYSSDECLDWTETVPGKCEIIDVKLKPRTSHSEADYSNFKCKNCQKYDTPICFVCKSDISKNESTRRQKCHVAHCHKYYHLECLDHWPQTQFNGGEPSKNNKKIDEYFEALTCPRHVCHTCVSDDPRGCKTRFSGDKLARCVRCPATYHSFTKCLPAGTQILTASHIICPRHYEHKPGKVPCHVNTGWCFICALGGSLICCEYCPTSFHAECLNIKPPEGGYMCEDCETGRLPLYGEMVWVKLGHYRWWPGIILHPSEIPENILAVKHNLGEFVVRFFGQYDHYWVNRGRVFPFQEGDSGRISSQKSKIDAAFTTAMEHAQRACEILKTAQPNEEESLDIASSLLPPHYVKLKVNKPCGSLCGRRSEDPESSLTQCECNPNDEDPCGPYSQCLNRMLLTECGPTCRAGDRCNNRAFEKRLYPKLVPYRTPSRGWGLKTLEDIKAGQFVIEYVGELIDEEEFRRRMRRKHEIRDENFYFLTLDKERMIDAGPKGNLARFMNHCCEPNCETQKWTVLGDVRVGLFALYDIPANSEVTFNYNLECAGIEKKRCMCGAKRCSGYIGAKPKQEESQLKKPKIAGKRTYKKRKTTEESPSSKNKPKRPIGRPPKPRELTEIEKDLLIIRNATNGLSSDESSRSMSSEYERNPKALKRKRVSFSTEEIILYDGAESPNVKRQRLEERLDTGD